MRSPTRSLGARNPERGVEKLFIEHGEHLAHLVEAITATGDVHGELLGEPSPELTARFADDGPVQLFTLYQSL